MEERFPHIKSQETINSETTEYRWFKWYMMVSLAITALFYVFVIAAIIKYLVS